MIKQIPCKVWVVSVWLLKIFMIHYPKTPRLGSPICLDSMAQSCHRSPVKNFPAKGNYLSFFLCQICISRTSPTKERVQQGMSGKSHCVKSPGCQGCSATRCIDHPKSREEFGLPVSIDHVVQRAGSQTQVQERFYSTFWSDDLID